MADEGRLSDRSIRAGEIVFAAIVTALAIALYLATPWLISNFRSDTPFQLSPAFYPRLALAVAAAGAVLHILYLRRGGHRVEENDEFEVGDSNWRLVVVGIALFLGYVLTLAWLGYAVATLLFVGVAALLCGLTARQAILLAAGASAVLYGLFVLALKVWFPQPAIQSLFG